MHLKLVLAAPGGDRKRKDWDASTTLTFTNNAESASPAGAHPEKASGVKAIYAHVKLRAAAVRRGLREHRNRGALKAGAGLRIPMQNAPAHENQRPNEFPNRDHFAPELVYFSDCILQASGRGD